MYFAYLITNNVNQKVYIGITINPKERWQRHQSNARNEASIRGKGTYLYNAIRKYGIKNFTFEVVKEFQEKLDCCTYEVDTIIFFRENNIDNYNLHDGGNLGHAMSPKHPKWEQWKLALSKNSLANSKDTIARKAWINKLKKRRKGRKPSLGMKHTNEAKKYASEVSNRYWDTQDTFTRDINKVAKILKLSHKEAKKQFGISTTHYYRLKKRFTTNDSE